MKTFILLLSALIFALPTYAQKFPKVNITKAVSSVPTPQLTAKVSSEATRNGYRFLVGLSNSPAKQILNKHYQFTLEYRRAAQLYKQLWTPQLDVAQIRSGIERNIVNNTLRTALLKNLEQGNISEMEQDLSQYFLLTPQGSISPQAFAEDTNNYLLNHPHKPTWRLREAIKFGGQKHIELSLVRDMTELSPRAGAVKNGMELEETKKLFSLYERADELNQVIKGHLSKETPTEQETAAFLDALQELHVLYEELLAFARSTHSVQNTLKIYQTLLEDVEAVVAEHHRLPSYAIPEERELANAFDPLVFHNAANQFEEIIPILNKLYALTEKYPAQRFSEREAWLHIENFYIKNGFLPRSVQSRDVLDTRPQEALMFEALTYWTQNSAQFAQKINKLARR